MCDSCGCGCKPGRPAKGCDCRCSDCRKARESGYQVGKALRGLQAFASEVSKASMPAKDWLAAAKLPKGLSSAAKEKAQGFASPTTRVNPYTKQRELLMHPNDPRASGRKLSRINSSASGADEQGRMLASRRPSTRDFRGGNAGRQAAFTPVSEGGTSAVPRGAGAPFGYTGPRPERYKAGLERSEAIRTGKAPRKVPLPPYQDKTNPKWAFDTPPGLRPKTSVVDGQRRTTFVPYDPLGWR